MSEHETPLRFVLASRSPARLATLRAAGVEPVQVDKASAFDEHSVAGGSEQRQRVRLDVPSVCPQPCQPSSKPNRDSSGMSGIAEGKLTPLAAGVLRQAQLKVHQRSRDPGRNARLASMRKVACDCNLADCHILPRRDVHRRIAWNLRCPALPRTINKPSSRLGLRKTIGSGVGGALTSACDMTPSMSQSYMVCAWIRLF